MSFPLTTHPGNLFYLGWAVALIDLWHGDGLIF